MTADDSSTDHEILPRIGASWTDADHALVEGLRAGLTDEELSNQLGRTVNGIRKRAKMMLGLEHSRTTGRAAMELLRQQVGKDKDFDWVANVRESSSREGRRYWTAADDATLSDAWATRVPLPQIADQFKVPKQVAVSQLIALGLASSTVEVTDRLGCTPDGVVDEIQRRIALDDGTDHWWRSAVIYQIYIRSFADGDGDGIGDIAGIRSRLPYLARLGVDAIWITPWYASPMADGGYDVADFRAIAAEFGALADAEAMIDEAQQHGLRVILDIVPNHTSDQHAWFQAALEADPGSPQRARYWFRPGRGPDGALPPNDWHSVFGGPAWTRLLNDEGAPEEWYLHLFAPEQPDLNWTNPEVRNEFEDILRFWFDRGVDGFRIDVAHGLAKHTALPDIGLDEEGLLAEPDAADHPHWDRDEVHEIYRDWRRVADSYAETPQGGRVYAAEAWVRTESDRLARYLRPDELHTAFNFDFLRCAWDAGALRTSIDQHLGCLAEVGAPATWVLSNHDVPRHVTRYGRAATGLRVVRPGDGLRWARQADTDVALGTRRARAAALLMLALPGGAYVYQGDELGLPEVEDLPDDVLQDPIWTRSGHTVRGRDGCRVPLPWTDDGPALGFSPAAPWLPQPAAWMKLTVEAQTGDAESMLELYHSALRLRKSMPGLGDGPLRWREGLGDDVLAFDRPASNSASSPFPVGSVCCIVNLGAEPVPLPANAEILLTSVPLDRSAPGTGGRVALPADSAVWLTMSE